MFSTLFMNLLSFLGVLVLCVLITIVGVIFCMLVGGVITAMIGAFKKKDTEDNDNGSNT